MNREDIIRMAREAGFSVWDNERASMEGDGDALERFAALVAAHALSNIDPSKFMSYQEGYANGAEAANKRHCEVLRELHKTLEIQTRINAIKSRESK
jgi:hypothetical protein